MAGYTDTAYRRLCKAQGADVVVSEFVQAFAVLHGGRKVWDTIDFTEEQRPMGVQLFGADPEPMAEAARRVAERLRPDFIDLNFGCPAPNVTCANAGCALMKDLPRLESIARAVVRACAPLPVTGKIRIGWDERSVAASEACQRLEQAGCQAVAVHGRTGAQGYRGEADWGVIAQAVESVRIPVIGNGGLGSAAELLRRQSETGVRGAMIGRAALGNPWIFATLQAGLAAAREGGDPAGPESPSPTPKEHWPVILEYARMLIEQRAAWGMENPFASIRARLKALTKGLPGSRTIRGRIDHLHSLGELESLAREHLAGLLREPAA